MKAPDTVNEYVGNVSTTFADPAVPAGVVRVAEVLVTVPIVARCPPIDAVDRAERYVPLKVIDVPPAIEPLAGSMDVTVGVVSIGVTGDDVPPVPSPIEFVATTVKV